jgi:hypothetical protein
MILCLPLLQLKVKGSKLAPIPDIGTLEALRLGAKLSVMKSSMRELMEGSEFLRVINLHGLEIVDKLPSNIPVMRRWLSVF